jgi:hypothetical protein
LKCNENSCLAYAGEDDWSPGCCLVCGRRTARGRQSPGDGHRRPLATELRELPGQNDDQHGQHTERCEQNIVAPSGNYSNHDQSPEYVPIDAVPDMGAELYISRPAKIGNGSQNSLKIRYFFADDENFSPAGEKN